MSQFDVCVKALQDSGCGVAFVGSNTVRVRFPPDPNDPLTAPDGEEREYSRVQFTLIVTKTLWELVERGWVDKEGRATDLYKGVLHGLGAAREGRTTPWSEVKAELGIGEEGVMAI